MIDFSQFDNFFSTAEYLSNDDVCKRAVIGCRWGSDDISEEAIKTFYEKKIKKH